MTGNQHAAHTVLVEAWSFATNSHAASRVYGAVLSLDHTTWAPQAPFRSPAASPSLSLSAPQTSR